ncbi:MAG: hypothetical protein FWD97_10420, partial [Defluviitaleaceae bacterium]|nr:hypothetical protein [Defluviitaleaceae bacterium]
MVERYISEQLMNELPRYFINLLWYLWEIHCDPDAKESIFILQYIKNGDNGKDCGSGDKDNSKCGYQRITMPLINKVIERDFGVTVDATIII